MDVFKNLKRISASAIAMIKRLNTIFFVLLRSAIFALSSMVIAVNSLVPVRLVAPLMK